MPVKEIAQSKKTPPESTSLNLQFEDNQLAAALFGERDAHLEKLEDKLGISAVSRGNEVALSGPAETLQAARTVLETLYKQLKAGDDIGKSQVDAALRMVTDMTAEEACADDSEKMHNIAGDVSIKTLRKTVKPYSHMQAEYIRELHAREMVFGLGPAGTGKTYIAVAMAVHRFMNKQVDRIILSRPAVEAGERLGFLPGDLKEKIDPYLRPLYDALFDMMPAEKVMHYIETGEIEIAPLAFMRGRTLANSYVILDEAQNTTPIQMKMFLTRMGENSQMVITGDLSQCDLPRGEKSGLRDAAEKLQGVEDIGTIRFGTKDVVRHPLAAKIVEAYEAYEKKGRLDLE